MTRRLNLGSAIASRQDWIAGCWIAACLVLGGASQGAALANALLQASAALILGYCLWTPSNYPRSPGERRLFMIAGALLLWIAIMAIPLPPALWQSLPGREMVTRGYRLMDMPLPWLSIALAPDRALRSATALLVPLATYFIARRLSAEAEKRATAAVVIMVVATIALGLAQMATGPESGLRFFDPTNRDSPVGFFANTNHYSAFLAASLPLGSAWLYTSMNRTSHKARRKWIVLLFCAWIMFGLFMGRSLAGIGLLIPAAFGTAYLLLGEKASRGMRLGLLFGTLIGIIATIAALVSIGSGAIGAKFEDAPSSRRHLTPVTIIAGNDMAPTGAGLGSFAPVYAMYQPDRLTSATWNNHAHNDYAELYLELGIPGLLLIAAFLLWFVLTGYRIWQRRSEPDILIAQTAWLSVGLLLLHSAVDYPLRTAAMASLVAVAVAVMMRAMAKSNSDNVRR